MESVLFYITETLPLRAYQGFRIEIIRYVVGSIGIFFATWIVFAPLLKQRRIRAAMPSKLLNTQIRRELFNSMRTICIFVALDIIVFDLAQGVSRAE